jgi:SEC-C motif
MSNLWLPPGSVPFDDEVEKVISESDDPALARQLAEELRDRGVDFATDDGFGAAIAAAEDPGHILFPREWSRMPLEDGRNVICAVVESKALERSIMDSTLEVETFGVIDEAPDNPMIHSLCPALTLRLKHYTTITPLEYPDCPCPWDWRLECPKGFAIAVKHPDPTETRVLYVASPPMTAMPAGFTLPPKEQKVGRNDRCPCGSGIKFKRCCGA